MLTKISFQIYIVITTITLLLFGYSLFSPHLSLNTFFLYLIAILGIPFIEILINSVKKDSTFCRIPEDWKYQIVIVFIGIISIIFINDFTLYQILTILYIIVSIVFLIEERYSFIIALFLLFLTIIGLTFHFKDIAETLSIYTYYFLVIGTVQSIINNKLKKYRVIKVNLNSIKKYSLYFYNFFLISYSIYFIVFYLSIKREPEIIPYASLIVFILYICFKLTGNNIAIPRSIFKR